MFKKGEAKRVFANLFHNNRDVAKIAFASLFLQAKKGVVENMCIIKKLIFSHDLFQCERGAERIVIRNLIYLILFGLLFLIIFTIFFKSI